jgi:hypothetical protein
VKESASRDLLPAHRWKCANRRHQGVIVCLGTFGHPCRVKSFRKAVSTVIDDLELYYSIIEQLTPVISILINLCSKLAQLQQQPANKICQPCECLDIASSCGCDEVIYRLGYVWC